MNSFLDKIVYVRRNKGGSLACLTRSCIPLFTDREYPDDITVVDRGDEWNEYADINGYRAFLASQNSFFRRPPKFLFSIFFDSYCQMSCKYCCRIKKGRLDLQRLASFMDRYSDLMAAFNVYGGEPLFSTDLIREIRQRSNARILISTGLGMPFSEMKSCVEKILKYNRDLPLHFAVSIDPPADKIENYPRVYPPFEDWYTELIKRIKWIASLGGGFSIGTSTVISKYGYNVDRLKMDLEGVPVVLLPVVHSKENEMTSEGKIEMEKYYASLPVYGTPFSSYVPFVKNGCASLRKFLNLFTAYDGSVGMCRGNGTDFGTLEDVDEVKYADLLRRAYYGNKCLDGKCAECAYAFQCGGECLFNPNDSLCEGPRAQTELYLKKLSNMDGLPDINKLLPHRASVLRELQTTPLMECDEFFTYSKSIWKK